jgi:FkbM family methyltransferase
MSIFNVLRHIVNHPLNKSHKIRALSRYVKWQIGGRLVPGEVSFQWINNSKLLVRPGEHAVTGNIYSGLFEFPDMAFLLHVLRKEDLFIDIGANVGTYTVLASACVGASTYCFEPVPSTYSRLMTNIRLNGLDDRVNALNIALGSQRGELVFSSDQNCMNHVLADNEEKGNTVTVDVSTLDEELKDDPFLIKIDVEGYESPALEGAQNTLKNSNLCGVILELNGSGQRYGFDEQDILQMMFDYGFETYSYNPFERKLTTLGYKNQEEGNTLFIRNIDRVLERINKAPQVDVHGILI